MFFEQNLIDQYKTLVPNLDGYMYSYSTLANRKLLKSIGRAMKQCCGTNIGAGYLDTSNRMLNESFKNNTNEYDFIGIFKIDISLLKSNMIVDNMMGFIIVQRGECIKYPHIYSINLICSPPSYKKGLMLFGAYIYSLINNTFIQDKRGVLELANSYFNPAGLCLYTKLGFVISHDMYGNDCFKDYYNLPMILDIQNYGSTIDEQNTKLFRIINGDKTAEFKKNKLCSEQNSNIQILSGLILNLIIFVSNQKDDYIIDDKTAGDYNINYNTLYNTIMMHEKSKSSNSSIASNTNNVNLNKLNNFLGSINDLSDDDILNILNMAVVKYNNQLLPVKSTTTRKSTRQSSQISNQIIPPSELVNTVNLVDTGRPVRQVRQVRTKRKRSSL